MERIYTFCVILIMIKQYGHVDVKFNCFPKVEFKGAGLYYTSLK